MFFFLLGHNFSIFVNNYFGTLSLSLDSCYKFSLLFFNATYVILVTSRSSCIVILDEQNLQFVH